MKLGILKTKWMGLLCAASLMACSDDDPKPLSFYSDSYEVPMGGIRYLGLESGNGDYLLEVEDTGIISAGTEQGWTTAGGTAIYVRGLLTGETRLKVTDNATHESRILRVKVTDSYVALQLTAVSEAGVTTPAWLEGARFLFLVNNAGRDAYLFHDTGRGTAFASGLELLRKANYELAYRDAGEAGLTLRQSPCADSSLPDEQAFTLRTSSYWMHYLNMHLNLGWATSADGGTSAEPEWYLLEESDGCKTAFCIDYVEMPEGILP